MRGSHFRLQVGDHLCHLCDRNRALRVLAVGGRRKVCVCRRSLGVLRQGLPLHLSQLFPEGPHFSITRVAATARRRPSSSRKNPVTSATSVTLVIPFPAGFTLILPHQRLELLLQKPVRHYTSAYPASGSPHEVLRATLNLVMPRTAKPKQLTYLQSRLVPNGTGTEPKTPPPDGVLEPKWTPKNRNDVQTPSQARSGDPQRVRLTSWQ